MACNCNTNSETNLLFACSGASNLGQLADQVMRSLKRDNIGTGTCLAAIGAEQAGYIESAKSANKNIVIDGCPVACGKHIFESRGLPFAHIVMTDFGVEKGKTPITEELIANITSQVTTLITGTEA